MKELQEKFKDVLIINSLDNVKLTCDTEIIPQVKFNYYSELYLLNNYTGFITFE